ncbi:hypothetical protein CXP39_01940 [Mesoplasma syrphidae]|uniref:Uncharacterized protein n=1 Tax=Mesoplasma syrphidae TaxID=225999 RepID=A0A2K9BRC1_9MOLU|nr:hypothetical protein [Mesoplasma syrphidae]AUF83552.1 hypothetical protein CXP39_01940 [Mesoplasma syrphidae]
MPSWAILLTTVIVIFSFIIICISASSYTKEKQYFYSKTENIISDNIILLKGEEHIWNNESILNDLKIEIQNSIRDNRRGEFKIKPSVTNNGPIKMKELKKIVAAALEKDLNMNFTSIANYKTKTHSTNTLSNTKPLSNNLSNSRSETSSLPNISKRNGNKSRVIK